MDLLQAPSRGALQHPLRATSFNFRIIVVARLRRDGILLVAHSGRRSTSVAAGVCRRASPRMTQLGQTHYSVFRSGASSCQQFDRRTRRWFDVAAVSRPKINRYRVERAVDL